MTISNPKYSLKDVGLIEPKQTKTKQMKDSTKVNILACLITLISILLMVLFWTGCTQKAKPIDNITPIDTNVYREIKCKFNPIKADYVIQLRLGSTNKNLTFQRISTPYEYTTKQKVGDSIHLTTNFNQTDVFNGQMLIVSMVANDSIVLYSDTAIQTQILFRWVRIR
jgi:hypothetical protein